MEFKLKWLKYPSWFY